MDFRFRNCIESAMAMAEESPKEIRIVGKSKSSGLLRVIIVLLVGALAVAGWLYHRSVAAQSSQDFSPSTDIKSVIHLESFVVNLSGTEGNGYLRVGIDLGLGVKLKEGDSRGAYNGRLRDAILTVLGTGTVDQLLTPDGKTKLKADLLKAIQNRVPEIECREVYFTEFLVQH